MRAIVAVGALVLVACTTAPPQDEQVADHGAGTCDAAPVQDLVGRRRSDAVGADALRRSGARTLRWIAPDTAYTQDLRSDRINLETDRSGRVTAVRCF